MKNHSKGQMTIVNLIAVFITFVLYMAIVPVLDSIIETSAASISGSSNTMIDITIALMRIVPFFMLLALVITTLNYAIPHREGAGY